MKYDKVKDFKPRLWGIPFFDKSLFANLEMVSPGNGCTTHPRIPETFFAIESEMIVTFLIRLGSGNII